MPASIKRTRNWVSVLYPESAAENWMDILKDWKVDFFVSPLHDKDFSSNGESKKPHWHIILMFSGVKTKEQADEVFNSIQAVSCEAVSSLRGYARYLCHLDDLDKAQYDPNEVISYGTTDYIGIISLATDKYDSIADMIDYCDRENIISYAQLLRYAKANNEIWFRTLCDNGTLVMKEFIKSRTWEVSNSEFIT